METTDGKPFIVTTLASLRLAPSVLWFATLRERTAICEEATEMPAVAVSSAAVKDIGQTF
jgi:hypothetical protein